MAIVKDVTLSPTRRDGVGPWLASKVIIMALRDAKILPSWMSHSTVSSRPHQESPEDQIAAQDRRRSGQSHREKARHFLTTRNENLELWCTWLDIDQDVIIQRCRAILTPESAEDTLAKIATRLGSMEQRRRTSNVNDTHGAD